MVSFSTIGNTSIKVAKAKIFVNNALSTVKNSCNVEIVIPKLNVEIIFKEQVIHLS